LLDRLDPLRANRAAVVQPGMNTIMPLGNNSIGAFVGKVVSIRHSDMGGGQRKLESDLAGEATGTAPGNHYGTLTLVVGSDGLTNPVPFTYVGTTLMSSGAVVGISQSGMAQHTGEGHKLRYRGVARFLTTDPKLAAVNGLIFAVETEIDGATMTAKAEGYEWK
jgi:hypothetical protein